MRTEEEILWKLNMLQQENINDYDLGIYQSLRWVLHLVRTDELNRTERKCLESSCNFRSEEKGICWLDSDVDRKEKCPFEIVERHKFR